MSRRSIIHRETGRKHRRDLAIQAGSNVDTVVDNMVAQLGCSINDAAEGIALGAVAVMKRSIGAKATAAWLIQLAGVVGRGD